MSTTDPRTVTTNPVSSPIGQSTECSMCRYTSGHTSWCPRRDRRPLTQADIVRLDP